MNYSFQDANTIMVIGENHLLKWRNLSKKFNLRHSMNGGNRIFCSHACSVQVAKKKKNAMRDFSLLKLLKTYGELSIYELVAKWPNDKKMITTSVPMHTFRCRIFP